MWETFLDKKDAEAASKLFKKALSITPRRIHITEEKKDFGILELLTLLHERGSDLENVKEAYKWISTSTKFGI